MKLVQWAKFYPPEWGGMERVTADIAKGAAESSIASCVVAFARQLGLPDAEKLDGVEVVRARLRVSLLNQPLSLRWIWLALREGLKSDAVIVHVPNLLAAAPMLILGALRLMGLGPRQRILFWHADILGKGVVGAIVRPFEHLLAFFATQIIATSPPYAEASAILRAHKAKVKIIPLGIDSPPDAPKPALPMDLVDRIGSRPIVLSVGRLVPYKGFDVLVRAMAILRPDAVCVIVGEGPEQGALEALIAAEGVADRVILSGKRSTNDLDSLFRHASLYCMASNTRAEAFGVVLLEAMSHGLPIVACKIAGSGVPWVAVDGANALLVPVNEPSSLAYALETVLLKPLFAEKMGKAGLDRFNMQFTRNLMVSTVGHLHLPGEFDGVGVVR